MSCGTSSRYGSSLLLKTTDLSIQGALYDAGVAPSPGRRGSLGRLILVVLTLLSFRTYATLHCRARPPHPALPGRFSYRQVLLPVPRPRGRASEPCCRSAARGSFASAPCWSVPSA